MNYCPGFSRILSKIINDIERHISLINIKTIHILPVLHISNNDKPEYAQEIRDCKDDHDDSE